MTKTPDPEITAPAGDTSTGTEAGERIAKALARAGIGSRRDVERMISEGRVRLNGKVLETPATLITTLEGITVDGEKVALADVTKVWRLNKVRGQLTTHKDPEGRPTVFEKLPEHMGRVISVGRLDMNTEGLLLLTNDGALARWMELPENALVRRYRVRVFGRVTQAALNRLKDGITIDGIHYGEVDAKLEAQKKPREAKGKDNKAADSAKNAPGFSSANTWLSVAIREGKNREVRRLMEYLGLTVNRLIRTHYGPFALGTLPLGAVAPVGDKQLRDIMPDFFKDASESIAQQKVKRDPSKWAKAKPVAKKPGMARRRKASDPEQEGTRSHKKPDSRRGEGRYSDRSSDGKRSERRSGERSEGRSEGRHSPAQGRGPARDTNPASATKSAYGKKREDGGRPAGGAKPTKGARPARDAQSTTRDARASNDKRPVSDKRPARDSKPTRDARPVKGARPDRGAKPTNRASQSTRKGADKNTSQSRPPRGPRKPS